MKPIRGMVVGLAAFSALALACNLDKESVGPALLSFERTQASGAPLFRDSVAPQATDPAIDQALDRHYVWLDTTARSNHKLFVFMSGMGQHPADRKSTRLNSSHLVISYAVFCLKKK